jgi:hypothetical protein
MNWFKLFVRDLIRALMLTGVVTRILISLRGYYVVAMAKFRFLRLASKHQANGAVSSEKFKPVLSEYYFVGALLELIQVYFSEIRMTRFSTTVQKQTESR